MDFETAWCSKTYTLKKMTCEANVRDPRFKAWGCGVMYLGEQAKATWVPHAELPAFFNSVDWSTTAGMAHNAQFDMSILSWHYGHIPCAIFDTLSMSRALYGVTGGNRLDDLARRFGLPAKGTALESSDGYLDTLPPSVEAELATYCEHDTWLCAQAFGRLARGYPVKELRLIDMTLRMFVNPVLELDKDMLRAAIYEERSKRETLLKKLQATSEQLSSNDAFAELLRTLGVEPPTKAKRPTPKTPAPVGVNFAFAKTDAAFQALVAHENEDISTLCEARLLVKSTQSRTRAQRFLDVASRGTLPVPLTYYAAHTGRWGGSKGEGLNMQNLKRGSFLRRAVYAPAGYVLVVADLAQIEPRVLAYLSDYKALLQVFAAGGDPYAAFGATMFGIPGLSKESHPDLRQSAKSALLGAGYGLGWANFAGQLLTGFLGAPPVLYGIAFAKQLGIRALHVERFAADPINAERMRDIPRICTDEELVVHCTISSSIITTYRQHANPVVKFWYTCDKFISKALSSGSSTPRVTMEHKGLWITPNKIKLPNGMHLNYPDLHGTPDESGRVQWVYGADKKKLYGGKLAENIVQAVARCVMTDGMLRVQKRYPVVLTVHDEICVLVPKEEAAEAAPWVREQMIKEAPFLPGLPLDATVAYAERYGDAK